MYIYLYINISVTCSGQYTHMESDLYITFLPVPYGSPTVSSEICITGMYMLYLDSDIYILHFCLYPMVPPQFHQRSASQVHVCIQHV